MSNTQAIALRESSRRMVGYLHISAGRASGPGPDLPGARSIQGELFAEQVRKNPGLWLGACFVLGCET